MLTDASPIADAVLLDDEGEEVRLGDSWSERPAAVVFLRHFGCTFCREHAADVQQRYDEIEAAGGTAVAVGLGTPAHAAQFRELSGIEFGLLVAEDTSLHERAGLTRGNWLRVIGPQIIPRAIAAMRKGHRAKRTRADMSQLGGTFVIAPGGEIAYAHKASSSADNAPLRDIIAGIERAALTPG